MVVSLTLLVACADPAPAEAPRPASDFRPGRRTRSPGGEWEAVVAEGGALAVRRAGAFGAERAVDEEVDPRVAFTPDDAVLVYAKRGEFGETDLWKVDARGDVPVQLTDWTGSEDRPVVSPDGRRVAFVSGRTGLAAWWVVGIDGGGAVQVTNVGVTKSRPGVAPEGWTPPPDGTVYAWGDGGLSWVAEGRRYTVTP
jgi:dipeptidyl aminopeptidase/acylaminoacyl peptidase